MAFRLRLRKRVDRELRRLAGKELTAALDRLRKARPGVEDVHDARKRLKKVRAIHGLVEADHGKGVSDSRKRLRAVNQALSRLRDADATLGALTKLRQVDRRLFSPHAFARVERRLAALKRAAAKDVHHDEPWPAVMRELRRIRRGVRDWNPGHRNFGALEAGIRKSLEDGRAALSRARRRRQPGDFHEWRKTVKALWYQLRLLERLGPAVQRDIRSLHRAESCLGDDHDLVVLGALLATNTATRRLIDPQRLRRAAERQHQRLRRTAIAATRKLYARSPRAYVKALKRAWRKNNHGGHRANRDNKSP